MVLQENIDTTTPTGKLFFNIFGALAEFERNVIIERTRAGLDASKARCRKGGYEPVLNEEKQDAARTLLNAGHEFSKIARTLGVSERTIRRFAGG